MIAGAAALHVLAAATWLLRNSELGLEQGSPCPRPAELAARSGAGRETGRAEGAQVEAPAAQGKSLALTCGKAEIFEQTDYRWREENGGLRFHQASEMKGLEREKGAWPLRCRSFLGEAGAGGRRIGELAAPALRRQAMDGIREEYGLSDRHAWRIAGQYRGTQCHMPAVLAGGDALTRRVVAQGAEHGRFVRHPDAP